MSITKTKIEEIANLARIKLTEEEKNIYIEQLSSILDYFKQLKEVDTSKITPLINANLEFNVLRDDIIDDCEKDIAEEILCQLPEKKGRNIKVKKIL
ncbi:Asp-tRNA(Asn)/Glu-tRNA(Gln) amidotransferase subunit GatC [Patescibacteria group bacterium]